MSWFKSKPRRKLTRKHGLGGALAAAAILVAVVLRRKRGAAKASQDAVSDEGTVTES